MDVPADEVPPQPPPMPPPPAAPGAAPGKESYVEEEPARAVGWITAAVTAVSGGLVFFGLTPIPEDQQAELAGTLVTGAITIRSIVELIRRKVTSPANRRRLDRQLAAASGAVITDVTQPPPDYYEHG